MSRHYWQELAQLPREPAEPDWLERCLARNAQTSYLRQFGSPRNIDEFRANVPIVTYEQMLPWIERVAREPNDVVFAGSPLAWERTGGSTGGAKLIPYSSEGLQDFRRALLPWLVDAARVHELSGGVYLAISPATRSPEYIGDVPLGLTDGDYIGPAAGEILAKLSVVPFEVAAIEDVEKWRAKTLRYLGSALDLELISCWSPTFLLRLLDELGDPQAMWPRLRLVSCWASGASRPFAEALAARLPQAQLQPKGLMSTECVVSVPNAHGRAVLTPHGFFEFIDGGQTQLAGNSQFVGNSQRADTSQLAGELQVGSTYEVVATTASGLYRYRTGDLVTCTGFDAAGFPELDFSGRSDVCSDLVGEKLTEPFVAGCITDVPGFRVLAPAADGGGYVLATDREVGTDAQLLERSLCRNPQYAYARRLGQLRAVQLVQVDDLLERYVAAQLQAGARLGDVKPVVLGSMPGWLSKLGVPL